MVGVKQFDINEALDRAMAVFWDLGYEATSVDDLTKATRVSRSSLYNTFGNKEDLFILVIDHYLEKSRPAFQAALDHADLYAAVLGALTVLKDRLMEKSSKAGCLLVLAAENSESRAPGIKRRVARAFADEDRAFYARFRQAQVDGQLAAAADAQVLARFFSAQGRAMGINARISGDPSVHDDVIKMSLEALRPYLQSPLTKSASA
ncbi:TetR/AcrR family transcriptional regulator [Roseobacter sp. YSTF-M11]|uniref:TetR/AcrR family transcriptional regulator n=1 Tax=Roseobacter insulae TaxID=2859783 RepID=A0A9X1FRI8_9RHOB|nr:TetR/AcrR family transcriptional regulator [Roseobacter insulae]MBW4706322.1 TetR/AcrR family transcriptional regulator [Roseobacter insulae]